MLQNNDLRSDSGGKKGYGVYLDRVCNLLVSTVRQPPQFHPSIHYLYPLSPIQGRGGLLEPIQLSLGEKTGVHPGQVPVHHRATYRPTTTYTHK